jgi:hypothetical protein
MPDFFSASTAAAVLLCTIITATGLLPAPGLLAWNSISAARSVQPMSWAPEAMRAIVAAAPLPGSKVTFRSSCLKNPFSAGTRKHAAGPSKRVSS